MKYSLTVCEHIFKAEVRNIGAKDAQCFINTLTLQLASCSLNMDYSWFCHNAANNCGDQPVELEMSKAACVN